MSVVSNSSVEVESSADSSNEEQQQHHHQHQALKEERKFVLPNELYKSLLASAVLGKTVLNRNLNFKDNLSSFKGNLNALDSALKELKDIKGLSVSSVPAFPRNLAQLRLTEDQDEVSRERVYKRYTVIIYNATSARLRERVRELITRDARRAIHQRQY